MNFYEAELQKALKSNFESGQLRENGNSLPFFEKLARTFPVIGSKIDWEKVPDSIELVELQESAQINRFIGFFDEVCAKFSLSGDVIYVGDSATEFALESAVDVMKKILPELLSIPQHHYFIGPGYSWCICLTMEGDMAFGFSPRSSD